MYLQGSGYSAEPAREGDAKPETLPHMFSKDWELNLDALEVESSDSKLVVPLKQHHSSSHSVPSAMHEPMSPEPGACQLSPVCGVQCLICAATTTEHDLHAACKALEPALQAKYIEDGIAGMPSTCATDVCRSSWMKTGMR